MVLYNIILRLYPLIAKVLALFNPKAKLWMKGQDQVWDHIHQLKANINKPLIWMHCSSYGEFEQGLPIIEQLKINYPQYQIWLTFFSPSGYEHRKNDPAIDFVSYMPLDSQANASHFLDIVHPELILFVKYEFWYHYLNEAHKRNIPTLLVSAIFRKDQLFFKFYGGFYRKMLNLFTSIFVQNENSKKLIESIVDKNKISISGDTRFDRVQSNALNIISYDWVRHLNKAKIIIAGSTWEKDHQHLFKMVQAHSNINWIIVPHLVDKKSIQRCLSIFPNAITLSECIHSTQAYLSPKVLIVDSIGILRNLYQYAHLTYIGGGFGKDGIHNVLEPAAYGSPVIWGPEDSKFAEAKGLIKIGGGFKINSFKEFSDQVNQLLNEEAVHKNASENAANFIKINAGATQKIMDYVVKNRLLTN